MALRNQPYLPLYVQDFLTDEKLMECSAQATGVYARLMCIMHKSERYGTILLKQKHKQSTKQVKNFASQLALHMPYDFALIEDSLEELVNENVLQIDGDYLLQKRMVKDAEISDKRAISGKKGGENTQKNIPKFASTFAKAKNEANTEYENEIENEIEYVNRNNTLTTSSNTLNVKDSFVDESTKKNLQKKPPTQEIEPIGAERVKLAARESWDDVGWRESVCMANRLTPDDLSRWMAKYNASLMNDVIHDFSTRVYKKMFGGWLSGQFSKGYTLPKANEPERTRTLKVIN